MVENVSASVSVSPSDFRFAALHGREDSLAGEGSLVGEGSFGDVSDDALTLAFTLTTTSEGA